MGDGVLVQGAPKGIYFYREEVAEYWRRLHNEENHGS